MRKVIVACGLMAFMLAGCDSASDDKETIVSKKGTIPSGYDLISSDQIDSYTDVFEIEHKETKQRYSVVRFQGYGITMSPLPSKGDK